MKYLTITVLLLSMPIVGHAADSMPLDKNASSHPSFFPLDAARGEQPGIPLSKQRNIKPLRSDSTAIEGGFLRLDRRLLSTAPQQHGLIITPVERGPSSSPAIIRGPDLPSTPTESTEPPLPSANTSNDPILSLFDSSAGTALPSFRRALKNRQDATPLAAEVSTSIVHHWPLPETTEQKVSSRYGDRADPLDHGAQFHSGIDIAAAVGTPVLASADGEVTHVSSDALYGKSITIRHRDGSLSQYGHLSQQQVKKGEHVYTGQVIGAVGATGRVTGAHLDYRLSKDGLNFDPLSMLDRPASVPLETKTADPHHAAAADTPKSNASPKQGRLIIVR